MSRTATACVLAAIAGLGACGSPSESPTPADADCVKSAVHIVLHVERARLWGTDLDRDKAVSIVPRSDVSWTFDPGPPPSLVDVSGRTVGHEGDAFYSACFDAARNTYVIAPDDLPQQAPGA